MTAIPVLETERLVMRGPEPRDWDGFAAFFTSDRAAHVGGPLTRRRAWNAFALEFGHWTIRGFGMWAVTERGGDACLGMVGCWFPEGWPEREIGWMVWEAAEGRGIAHEAALAAREHAYRSLGWPSAVSYIDPANDRSIRLARRLGARSEGETTLPDDARALVYRHPGPEALQ